MAIVNLGILFYFILVYFICIYYRIMTSVDDNKYVNDMRDINNLLNSSDKKICLWVIDMQNDFIDAPFQDTTLFNNDDYNEAINVAPGTKLLPEPFKKVETRDADSWEKVKPTEIKKVIPTEIKKVIPTEIKKIKKPFKINNGRFAIKEGIHCVDDVIYYINLLTSDIYNDRLKNIIFSRDIHTTDDDKNANHCSFENKGKEGFIDGIGFPAHCVNGTAGCLLNEKIKEKCKEFGDKSLVVMKGCSQKYDSFGAFPYDCKEGKQYSNKRQHNGCEQKCSDNVDSIDKNTGSYVLEKDDWFTEKVNLNTNGKRKINDVIYDTKDIHGANMIHLVCGLAGDYCVRDTAINLKFAYPESTVAVIADATRYAALYDSVIVPDVLIPDVFENKEKRTEFLENTLHLKSFTDSIASQPTYFLTPPDVMLYTYSDKMLPGEGVIFTMDNGNGRKSNLNYTKPSNSERPIQVPNNKYWCLSRFYYLLGKQMEYCSENSKNSKKCYKKATGFKDNEYNGKKVGRLSLAYDVVNENKKIQGQLEEQLQNYQNSQPPLAQGGKRRRRKTKKRHNKKPKRKVTKKRHHKKTKKRKVRKTKKNKTRKR
jgi:nicotinamidase-related amidase